MANKILKGGISNYIYRWDTNAGACDSCQELNNTIYNSEMTYRKNHIQTANVLLK